MTSSTTDRLSARDLEKLIREVEPSALLVPARILRRVIKKHCGLSGLGLRVPHRKSYILPSNDLLSIASPGELGLEPGALLPELLFLFPTPSDTRLESSSTEEMLLRYWGFLFHLEIHRAFERLRQEGKLTEPAVRARIRRIGVVEFEEAEEVLRQENYLLKPGPDAGNPDLWPGDLSGTYEEFAAVYLSPTTKPSRRSSPKTPITPPSSIAPGCAGPAIRFLLAQLLLPNRTSRKSATSRKGSSPRCCARAPIPRRGAATRCAPPSF
jgi:hypothetical protein